MEEVKIKFRKRSLFKFMGYALPFILIGGQISYKGIIDDNKLFMVIGFIVSVIFIGLLLLVLYKFLTFSFALILNKDGLKDEISPLQFGIVRWPDIKTISLDKNDPTKIVIYLNSNKKWKQKLVNENQRKLYVSNKTKYGSPMVIDAKKLNEKVEDVMTKIKGFPVKVID